ncbi:neuronal acetylcholine receptor subunit alpha-10-like [Ptychodera flava]|uniref:neuronal acetylcholine receptor subunit alpha-10-like n=1 Tax=Ptychodera flava TaxID=63121 RepID=UPI00396A37CE
MPRMPLTTKIGLVAFVLLLYWPQGDECNADLHRLYEDKFSNYSNLVRPVRDLSTVTNVDMALFLNLVLDMDEKSQTLISNVWVTLSWYDEYIWWNKTEYGGIHDLKIPAEQLWLPDIYFYQNAANKYENFLKGHLAVVYSTGNVLWTAPVIFRGHCKIKPTYFPFDEQKCTMKFGTWQYDGFEVALNGSGDRSAYVSDGEWDLSNLTASSNRQYYPDTPGIPYTDVTYDIFFRRRCLFYVFYLIMPCTLISLMTILTFFLPAESQGKISLGVTVLLSLTVFLLLVAEVMPASNEVPVIGQYYAATMVLISVSLSMNVLVVNLYYRGPEKDSLPVPDWAKKYLIGYVGWFLNVNINHDMPVKIVNSRNAAAKSSAELIPLTAVNGVDGDSLQCPDSPIPMLRLNSSYRSDVDGSPGMNHSSRTKYNSSLASHTEEKENIVLLKQILRELRHLNKYNEKQVEKCRIQREWKRVAKVTDRICLIMYLVGTVSTVMVIVCQIPW